MQRVLVNAAATLSHTFYATDTEDLTDPAGSPTPTYAVVDAAGASVGSGNASIVTGAGKLTAPLAAQTILKNLTVTWSATVGGNAVVEVDQVEVVAGYFFTLAEGRGSDASLGDTSKYTTQQLLDARTEVERECETICDRAFIRRYARVVLGGTGTSRLILAHPEPDRSVSEVRSIRSVSMADQVDGTFVPFTAGQLADLASLDDGTIVRASGDIFTEGFDNLVVEYEYARSFLPEDLKRAALIRFRSRLNLHRSGVPDRATSYTAADGGTYRITLPDAYRTGIPEVDGPYSRYSRRVRTGPNGGNVPASRTLSYEPQRFSLFHRPARW